MAMRMTGISGGFDPKIVDKLIEAEKVPVEMAKKRKETINTEKKEVQKLETYLNELESSLTGMRTYNEFAKLKVDSSHPDIIDGVADANAQRGEYEFEVRGLAKRDKELAYGFPDKNETPVGFGYMLIEREDMGPFEVVIEPGSTLQDVSDRINDANAGVKAMVINTKYKPDPYRLLVVSERSGAEARVSIDEDTTFLEFKSQVTGRGLDVLFEDVPVTDEKNQLSELVPGVVFNVKRSEPGTRVQVNVVEDVDKTFEQIKNFVTKYNQIADFAKKQFTYDKDQKKAGILSADGSLKMIVRQLQNQLGREPSSAGKYNTLADIGITTNPKSGSLDMNEAKVRQALTEDYDGVAQIFARSRDGTAGLAERLADTLKGFKDPTSGAVKSRLRALDRIMETQDQAIERKERSLETRQETLHRRFANLDSQMSQLQAQGNFIQQRFGNQGGG